MIPKILARSAVLSPCGTWRSELRRRWVEDEDPLRLVAVCLNPSTADAEVDDPTTGKLCGFANRWGFGELVLLNLFAFRATDPAELRRVLDRDPGRALGPDNVRLLIEASESPDPVLVAWGSISGPLASAASPGVSKLCRRVLQKQRRLWCLGRTKDGSPRHPLYVPWAQGPEVWA